MAAPPPGTRTNRASAAESQPRKQPNDRQPINSSFPGYAQRRTGWGARRQPVKHLRAQASRPVLQGAPRHGNRPVPLAERRAVASGWAALTRAGHALTLETMIRGALLDLAGVIYEGDHALPGALSAIERLRQAGLSMRFVTNTTRMPKRKVLGRLAKLGLDIRESELFTPGEAARNWLAANDCSPSLLVHPNLVEEFEGEGGRPHRAVIIGDAGEDFDFARLNHAFRELIGGAPFIALAKNRSFKDDDGALSLDAGAFVTALEFATGREALVLGKPSPAFFQATLASMSCAPESAVMVGDDAESDIAGALDAGLAAAVLVRTGKYRAGDETRCSPKPTATVADRSAATEGILAQRVTWPPARGTSTVPAASAGDVRTARAAD